MSEVIELITSLDPVLRHPTRFSIVTILLTTGPKTMGEIAKILNIDWGPLSTHVERLKKEGYIEAKKGITMKGPRTFLFITRKGVEKYYEYLDTLEKILEKTRKISNKK